MFDKRFLTLLAAAVLVAACGGGGNGSGLSSGGNNPPPANGGGDGSGDNSTPSDQQLKGHLSVVANQIVYIKHDRSMYLPVKLSGLESSNGINDVAPGYTGNEPPPPAYQGDCNPCAPDTTLGPAAPIAAFGIRIDKRVQRNADSDSIGNQSAIGRVAISLEERADSPAIAAGQQPEIMRFVVDRVRITTNDIGEVSAEVLADSRLHVYGRNAAGTEVRDTISVPSGAVTMLPMSRIPDNFGDDTSAILLLDLEKAFSQAGEKLSALHNIAGHFAINFTFSSLQFVRPASSTLGLEHKELAGAEITVNDQPPVRGGGLIGNAWIRWFDPHPPADDNR